MSRDQRGRPVRVALVPGVLALLPEYAGLTDPVADLRAACLRAVAWLAGAVADDPGSDDPEADDPEAGIEVVAGQQGARVARSLLDAAGCTNRAIAPVVQGEGGSICTSSAIAPVVQGEGGSICTSSAIAPVVQGGRGRRDAPRPRGLLVVGNGSARRTERAPGYHDERASAFDDDLRARLTADPDSLADLDVGLAGQLWADVASLVRLGGAVRLDPSTVVAEYDDDPFGVQYWVLRWEGRWQEAAP